MRTTEHELGKYQEWDVRDWDWYYEMYQTDLDREPFKRWPSALLTEPFKDWLGYFRHAKSEPSIRIDGPRLPKPETIAAAVEKGKEIHRLLEIVRLKKEVEEKARKKAEENEELQRRLAAHAREAARAARKRKRELAEAQTFLHTEPPWVSGQLVHFEDVKHLYLTRDWEYSLYSNTKGTDTNCPGWVTIFLKVDKLHLPFGYVCTNLEDRPDSLQHATFIFERCDLTKWEETPRDRSRTV